MRASHNTTGDSQPLYHSIHSPRDICTETCSSKRAPTTCHLRRILFVTALTHHVTSSAKLVRHSINTHHVTSTANCSSQNDSTPHVPSAANPFRHSTNTPHVTSSAKLVRHSISTHHVTSAAKLVRHSINTHHVTSAAKLARIHAAKAGRGNPGCWCQNDLSRVSSDDASETDRRKAQLMPYAWTAT